MSLQTTPLASLLRQRYSRALMRRAATLTRRIFSNSARSRRIFSRSTLAFRHKLPEPGYTTCLPVHLERTETPTHHTSQQSSLPTSSFLALAASFALTGGIHYTLTYPIYSNPRPTSTSKDLPKPNHDLTSLHDELLLPHPGPRKGDSATAYASQHELEKKKKKLGIAVFSLLG
jgi:hypothetical protein